MYLLHKWKRVDIHRLHHPVPRGGVVILQPSQPWQRRCHIQKATKEINQMLGCIPAGKALDNNSSRAANCRGLDVRVRCSGLALRDANAVQFRANGSAQILPTITILQCMYSCCILAAHSHDLVPGHSRHDS